MDDTRKRNLAWTRLIVLRSSPPTTWDDVAVSNFHQILTDLEQAFGEDLAVFRIPDEQMKQVPLYVQRLPRSGRPVPPPTMSSRRKCPSHYALQQVEGVYLYVQPLVSAAANFKALIQSDNPNGQGLENRAGFVGDLEAVPLNEGQRTQFAHAEKELRDTAQLRQQGLA